MTAKVHRCGDSGAQTSTGKPCRRRVQEEGERCPDHPAARSVQVGDTLVHVLDHTGSVTVIDGKTHVCEVGMALRMGLANPSPEVARDYFPIMELVPGEERPDPGEVLEGIPVFAWVTQQMAAELITFTGRHLQTLEERGLPSRGHRSTKRYPLPHLVVWMQEYQHVVRDRGRCEWLPFRVAWARHRLELEEGDAAEEAGEHIRRGRRGGA